MAATYRSRSFTVNDENSPQTNVVPPPGTTAGDLLLAFQISDADDAFIKLAAPTGWDPAGQSQGTVGGSIGSRRPNFRIYKRIATATEPPQYQSFVDGTNAETVVAILAISDWDQDTYASVTATVKTGGPSNQHTVDSVTGNEGDLLVTVHAADTGGTTAVRYYPTGPTGMQRRFGASTSGTAASEATNYCTMGIFTQELTTDGPTGSKIATFSESNHLWTTFSLVIPAVVTAPPPDTPGSILNIGQANGRNHYSVDVPNPNIGARELHETSEIETGYESDPRFIANEDGVHVQCRAFVDDPTTSGSQYARVELRPTAPGGDSEFGFDPRSGVHYQRATSRATHLAMTADGTPRPQVVLSQLHSGTGDVYQLLTQYISGQPRLVIRINGSSVDVPNPPGQRLEELYTEGDEFEHHLEIRPDANGEQRLYIYYQDLLVPYTSVPVSILQDLGAATFFEKVGCYNQSNVVDWGENPGEYFSVDISKIEHWHTGWSAPQNIYGWPTVDTGADTSTQVSQAFTRTATVTGSGILEHRWVILDGPDGVGTTVGTAAALSWTPSIPGNYLLRYSARNANGWATPDVLTVDVNPAPPGGVPPTIVATSTGQSTSLTQNHPINLPAGIQAGDQILIAFTQNDTSSAANITGNPNYTKVIEAGQGAVDSSNVRGSIFLCENSQAGGTPVTITTTTSQRATWIVYAIRGGTTPIEVESNVGANNTAATVPALTLDEGNYLSIMVIGVDYNQGTTFQPNLSAFRSEYANEINVVPTVNNSASTHSIDARLSNITSVASDSITYSSGTLEQFVAFNIAIPGLSATAPTVSVGNDIEVDQYDTVTKTATENNGGATITSRAWTVRSGPNQVGSTIGTTATLNWEPTVGGTYVIRYTASNSVGTHFDEFTATVNALNFPVTANLQLLGSLTGIKRVDIGQIDAPLTLAAARTGQKRMSFAPTATLKLSASVDGQRINAVFATLKLRGAAINVGRPGKADVSALIRLQASISDTSRVTPNVSVIAPLELIGDAVGEKHIESVTSATIKLAAAVTDAFKAIQRNRTATIKLAGDISNTLRSHNKSVFAELYFIGEATDTSRVTLNVPVSAILKLSTSIQTSSVRFNTNTFAFIHLRGSAFGQRIITEVANAILPRADNTTKYELVAVARIPQTNGPPTFLEVDPLDWVSINWSEELSGIPSMSASVKISSLTDSVKLRLQTPHDLPTELWLYRNGKHIFAGPLLGFNAQDEDSITLESKGLLVYTQMWYVTRDLVYKGIEQFQIVKGLIDQWQELEFGNFGIDTSDLPDSGVRRDVTYNYKELHNVYERILELSKLTDGFDFSIDPAGRNLELWFSQRGVDRSVGEDRIVFDQRNVTSSNIVCSIGPQDLASDAIGTGTGSATDITYVSRYYSPEVRAKYGRVGIMGTFGQVPDQSTLDSYTNAMLIARKEALLIPGPNARVSVDSDIGSYDIGDTVDYQLHSTLDVAGAYRIRKRTVTVRETGTESVSIEFV